LRLEGEIFLPCCSLTVWERGSSTISFLEVREEISPPSVWAGDQLAGKYVTFVPAIDGSPSFKIKFTILPPDEPGASGSDVALRVGRALQIRRLLRVPGKLSRN